MNRTAELLKFNRYLMLAILIPLCAIINCDWYLVSICRFEQQPGCQPDGSATNLNNDGSAALTIGPERSFTLNTTIPLIDRRFVGMNSTTPITLAATNLRFEVFDIKFDIKTAVLGLICANCPAIPTGFDFLEDRIYKADERFFFFHYKYENLLYELNANNTKISILDVFLNKSFGVRPFTHPNLDFMMIESKPTDTNYKYNNSTLSGDKIIFSNLQNSSPSTMFAIGDLDSNNTIQNGFEFITFRGSEPTDLFHYKTGTNSSSFDVNLLSSLAATINSTKSGDESNISAAYITDLNNDAFPDFIYVRNGKVFVTSYVGIINGTPQFENWSSPVLEITGQKINSILAIQMTGDSSPELIVETETELQFYVNNPKS